MSDPLVSVVIATYRRPAKLAGLVDALHAQTLPADRFEIVIVDDGSSDDTAAVLTKLAATSAVALRPILMDENRGPAAARNTGWRAAVAPVIAFTDDDCVPQPDWLAAGLAAMATGEVGVVGRTKPNPDQLGHRGPFSRTLDVTDTRFMQTCNVFYRRADLELVNGFDERIRAKGGEDTDLGWKVADLGREIVFADGAVVYHDISESRFRNALREASTMVDIPRVAVLHPQRARRQLHRRYFWKRTHPPALLGLLGLTAAMVTRRPLFLLALWPWLRFRYKRQPISRDPIERVLLLPHAFVLDVTEIVTMARGSIKHGTFVL